MSDDALTEKGQSDKMDLLLMKITRQFKDKRAKGEQYGKAGCDV